MVGSDGSGRDDDERNAARAGAFGRRSFLEGAAVGLEFRVDVAGHVVGVRLHKGPGLRDGEDGGNGVYRSGAGGVLPTGSWSPSNDRVDIAFQEGS